MPPDAGENTKVKPEPERPVPQARRAASPFDDYLAQFAGRQAFHLRPNTANPTPEPAAAAQPVGLAKAAPLHHRLARWAFAAAGALSVIYAGQLPSAPVPVQTVAVGSALPPPPPPVQLVAAHTAAAPVTTYVEVPQEHVTAAVQEVVGYTSPVITFSPPPAHSQLVLHIKQDVDAASDHTIDIIVQAQQQKPSEGEIKDAKNSFRDISSTLLGLLTLSNLAEKAGSKLLDKGMDRAWAALKRMIDELKKRIAKPAQGDERAVFVRTETTNGLAESAVANIAQPASKPNPILVRLAEAFVTLAQIFDPSEPGPKVYPISFIGDKLHCSEEEAAAILRAGPFVETSPGIWGLDPHFGNPELAVDLTFLKNLNFSW